jgi:hypothetical protein
MLHTQCRRMQPRGLTCGCLKASLQYDSCHGAYCRVFVVVPVLEGGGAVIVVVRYVVVVSVGGREPQAGSSMFLPCNVIAHNRQAQSFLLVSVGSPAPWAGRTKSSPLQRIRLRGVRCRGLLRRSDRDRCLICGGLRHAVGCRAVAAAIRGPRGIRSCSVDADRFLNGRRAQSARRHRERCRCGCRRLRRCRLCCGYAHHHAEGGNASQQKSCHVLSLSSHECLVLPDVRINVGNVRLGDFLTDQYMSNRPHGDVEVACNASEHKYSRGWKGLFLIDFCDPFEKADRAMVCRAAARLVARRSDLAVTQIPKENVTAPLIAGGVLLPTRDRDVRHRLYPEPAAVIISAYWPFESRLARGACVRGELNQRTVDGAGSSACCLSLVASAVIRAASGIG